MDENYDDDFRFRFRIYWVGVCVCGIILDGLGLGDFGDLVGGINLGGINYGGRGGEGRESGRRGIAMVYLVYYQYYQYYQTTRLPSSITLPPPEA